MRSGTRRRLATWMGAAALVCLVQSSLPALAVPRAVALSDGSTLNVWEQRGRGRSRRSTEVWQIHYTLTDSAGTRTGIVGPTADAARDSSPYLVKDDVGSAVLVWTRFDGSNNKIAYARFSGIAWTDFHYLTFGPGDDDDPRIGSGATGSFLFFVAKGNKYQYAPLDLLSGHLFAAPRSLNLASARRDIEPITRTISTQTGFDVPVTWLNPTVKGGRTGDRLVSIGQPDMLGGMDTPITLGQVRAAVWGVGSSAECSGMIVVIPAHNLKSAFVFRFDSDLRGVLQRVGLSREIDERFGENLAALYLPIVCN